MASINKVIIVGNLGRDPEMRTMPSGDQVANVSIATTDRWKDRETGEQREAIEWHRVSFHGRLAEIAGQYLRQGSQVYVEGSLRTRKYQKDGVDHYTTEIRADTMQMLGQRQDGGGNGGGRSGYDDQGYGSQGSNAGRQQPQQYGSQRGYGQGGGQRQQPQQGQQRGGYGGQQQRGPQQNQQRQQPQGGGGGGFQGGGSGFDDMDDSDIPFVDCSMKYDLESKLDRRIRKSRV